MNYALKPPKRDFDTPTLIVLSVLIFFYVVSR